MNFLRAIEALLVEEPEINQLTSEEEYWRKLTYGTTVSYLGKKGLIVFNKDLKYTNDEDDLHWEGPAYVTMRYINDLGEFKDIRLYQNEVFKSDFSILSKE